MHVGALVDPISNISRLIHAPGCDRLFQSHVSLYIECPLQYNQHFSYFILASWDSAMSGPIAFVLNSYHIAEGGDSTCRENASFGWW